MGAEEVLDRLLKELGDEGGRAEYEPTEFMLLLTLQDRGLVRVEGDVEGGEVELTDAGREHLGLKLEGDGETLTAEDGEGLSLDGEGLSLPSDDEDEERNKYIQVTGRLELVPRGRRIEAALSDDDPCSQGALNAKLVELANLGGGGEFDCATEEGTQVAVLQMRRLVTCSGKTVALTAAGLEYANELRAARRGW
jgi:hypothetical protein